MQGNMDEDSHTDFSQESRIMVGEIRDSEVSASNTNLENTNQETPITNPNSNEQSSNISGDQLQEFLNTVMQGIKAGQEESKKKLQLWRNLDSKLQLDRRNLKNKQLN